jgi:hypothetical protein
MQQMGTLPSQQPAPQPPWPSGPYNQATASSSHHPHPPPPPPPHYYPYPPPPPGAQHPHGSSSASGDSSAPPPGYMYPPHPSQHSHMPPPPHPYYHHHYPPRHGPGPSGMHGQSPVSRSDADKGGDGSSQGKHHDEGPSPYQYNMESPGRSDSGRSVQRTDSH